MGNRAVLAANMYITQVLNLIENCRRRNAFRLLATWLMPKPEAN